MWIFFCSFITNLSNPSMVGRKDLRTSRSLLLLLLLSALLLSQQIHISLRLLFREIPLQIHYFTLTQHYSRQSATRRPMLVRRVCMVCSELMFLKQTRRFNLLLRLEKRAMVDVAKQIVR